MVKVGDKVVLGRVFEGICTSVEGGWVYFDNGHAFTEIQMISYVKRSGWKVLESTEA